VHHRRLQRGIGDFRRDAEMRRHRGDVDDRAAAGRFHRGDEGLADQHRADQIVLGQHLDVLEGDVERVVRVGLAPEAPMSPPAQ